MRFLLIFVRVWEIFDYVEIPVMVNYRDGEKWKNWM